MGLERLSLVLELLVVDAEVACCATVGTRDLFERLVVKQIRQQDLLDLQVDPSQYLPSDDSTRGFDNIASALTVSSTLVDSWVSAAGKISRLAIGDPATPSLKVYRAPEDLTQNYPVQGLPMGTRGGMLITHIFPSDGEYTLIVESVFGDNMAGGNFGSVPCEKIEVLLDRERLQLIDWAAGRNGGGNCGGAR